MRIPVVTMGGATYTDVEVGFTEYLRGGVAITLGSAYDPLGVATVYMDGVPPAEGCVWIKDWSENTGVLESLTAAGLILPTGRQVQAGYAVAHEARLLVAPPEA